jgi:Putative polyhydroxyalkanoic acid system protein (PHA_gran_rgn)
MSKPFVATVSHQLTRQEAKSRIQAGLGQIRMLFPGFEERWTGDQMDFRVAAMGQTVTGRIEVLDDAARIEVHLPEVLAWFGTRIGRQITRQAALMLEKK